MGWRHVTLKSEIQTNKQNFKNELFMCFLFLNCYFSCSNGFTGLALSFVVASVQVSTAFSAALSPAYIQRESGLGQAGVQYSSCGVQTFIFALHFLRSYTPACAKPHVICCHFLSVFVVSLSEDMLVSEDCSFLRNFWAALTCRAD